MTMSLLYGLIFRNYFGILIGMNKYHIGALFLVVAVAGIIFLTAGNDAEDNPSVPALTERDMQGIHIMPDGAVMSGSGTVLQDAVVNPDGSITLPDGQTVIPANDYRR